MRDERRNEELKFDGSVKQNSRGEAILGVLEGPCADIINPTRNGRFYSEELWENVFNSDIAKEYFENGGYLGELDHPTDRSETCTEKVAICMPEPPHKNDKGQLIGRWDILDTPNGRITATLAKYGYKLGISSRGTGDVNEDYDGKETVDPSTYDFQGFDIVLLPAVKSARLNLVTESVGGKTFKQALTEAINSSDENSKRVMLETLNNLKIDYKSTKTDNIKEDKVDNKLAASDTGADIVKDLQESIKENKKLKDTVIGLQEKLSVCYTKEVNLVEQLEKYKASVISLSDSAKSSRALKAKVDSLNELLEKVNKENELLKSKCLKLTEAQKKSFNKSKSLNESISEKNDEMNNLKESFNLKESKYKERIQLLEESVAEEKKNLSIKSNEYASKISESNKLVERYKTIAKVAVDRYIESKARMIGSSAVEIKNRLKENYSFSDIDSVCESLSQYKLNISKLPFNVNKSKGVRVEVKESKEPIMPNSRFDDDIDDPMLKNLLNNI